MAFPPSFLDELKSRVGLSATIGRRVRLVRAGTVMKGLCPFHQEKTPSFTVDERRGTFHCFGCGAHGNAIDFVMRAENLGFREAVERLAGEAGMPIPVESPAQRAREDRLAGLHGVLEAAADCFRESLADRRSGEEARAYLDRRGLNAQAIERFGIGFAPPARTRLKEALAGRFPEEKLVEAGLLVRPEGGGATYDRFRGRVIFPIHDLRGRLVGFGGRIIGEGEPKYLNSPETELFQKGRLLYGYHRAAPAARRSGEVVAVEGYMDVIALHLAGIETAVAPLGTAMTEQQLALLWRLAPEPILCFDGDAAGTRAAARAAERALPLLKAGQSLRFATLPPGEDPDSLARGQGAGAVRAVLDAARPLGDVLLAGEMAGQPVDTPERRAGLRRRLRELAGRIDDRDTQAEYQAEFQRRCDAAFGTRPQRQGHAGGPGHWGGPGYPGGRAPFQRRPDGPWRGGARPVPGMMPESVPPPVPDRWSVHESRLMLLAIRDGPSLAEVAEGAGAMACRDPALEALRRDLVAALGGERLDSRAIERHLTELGHGPTLERLRGSAARHGWASVGSETSPEEALYHWRHSQVAWQLDEIQSEIALAERDFEADPSDRLVRLAAQRAELLRYRVELELERDTLRQAAAGGL